MKKTFFLKIFASVAIISFLLYKIGVDDIIETLAKSNWIYIIIGTFFFFVTLIIDSLNLFILLKKNGAKIPAMKLIRYNLYAWSLGLMLPGKSGDLVILPILKKEGVTAGKGLSAIMVNKLISLVLMALVASIGIYLFFGVNNFLIFMTVLVIGLIALYFMLSEKVRRFIRIKILKSYAKYFEGFSKSLKEYKKNGKKVILINVVLTITKILVGGICPVLLFYSVNRPVSFLFIIIIFNTAGLLALVPFTLSGLGIRESVSLFLFSQINVDMGSAGTVVILATIIAYTLGSIIFFIPKKWWLENKKLKK